MNRLVLLSLILLLITLFNKACGDDPLAEPSLVRLKLRMTGMEPFMKPGNNPNKNAFLLKKCKLHLTRFEFDGIRENAQDYYFSTSFDSLHTKMLDTDEPKQLIEFDVPQGSYQPVEITLHTNKKDSLAALIFHSEYYSQKTQDTLQIAFHFFKHHEALRMKVEKASGDSHILFRKEQVSTIQVAINMTHLLRFFNPNKLAHAGNNKIIISAKHNQDIYYQLAGRIDKSITATIQ